MSHFTVLVIGDNVDEQLAPFHEFECTGENDQYVQDIDITEDVKDDYAKKTTSRLKDTDGNIQSWFNEEGNYKLEFLREATEEEKKQTGLFGSGLCNGLRHVSTDPKDGLGYRTMIVEKPAGWEEIDVPYKDVMTLAQFAKEWHGVESVEFGSNPDIEGKHKYGYVLLNEDGSVNKIVDRTNPNAHWDWYTVGGRWNGFFKLKSGNYGMLGEPGLNRMNPDYERPASDRADSALKGSIDIEFMRNERAAEAAKTYDQARELLDPHPAIVPWKYFSDKADSKEITWDEARSLYGEQPGVKAFRGNGFSFDSPDNYNVTKEEYVERARKSAVATFAVIKDGKWYERGSMGWWGMVSNEKEDDQWYTEYSTLLDSVDDNTCLTIVDCHI